MRTAKYHDYILWRVLLFIILVILAVFVYINYVKPCEHELGGLEKVDATCTEDGYSYKECKLCGEQLEKKILPATGHKPEKISKENEKPHTLTEGGSYDLVVCCSTCDEQISKETVMVDGAHTVEIVVTKENIVEATCTEPGSYESVKTCKGCNAELERKTVETEIEHKFDVVEVEEITKPVTCTDDGSLEKVYYCGGCGVELGRETVTIEATDHDFGEYKLVYNYISGKVSLHIVCNNDGKTTVITEADGLEITHLEEDLPACCGIKYTIKYTYGDFVIEETKEFEPAPHKVCYTIVNDKGELVHDNTYDLPEAEYDEVYGEYYDVDKCPGIIRGDYIDNPDLNKWDENGFAKGTFKCALCGQFYMVTIYSAAYDTRLK